MKIKKISNNLYRKIEAESYKPFPKDIFTKKLEFSTDEHSAFIKKHLKNM